MGLFDGKAKQEAAEEEVMQKLSQVPLLDILIENILGDGAASWIREGQSYYDNCRRKVKIEPDSFEIKWSSYPEEIPGQREEVIHESVCYSYTKSGYLPLHQFSYDNGKKEIPTEQVCYLWASIIRERMAAKMPNCKFDSVYGDASFTYKVQPPSFKDWF